MCVADNSVDLYTATCPMCKFFRHTAKCPHKHETCRNRVNHPRHDVKYISNAEVGTFRGCGYCKWATTNPPPPPSKSGMLNVGWPGCCRPPSSSELNKIPPADWAAVHTVHRTPIPSDIKALLDAIQAPYGSPNTSPTSPTSAVSIAGSTPGSKDMCKGTAAPERKSSARANGSPSASLRSPTLKNRPPISGTGSGHSPQMKQARLAGGAQPGTSPGSNGVTSTDLTSNSTRRAPTDPSKPLKSIEGFRTTPPASIRKLGIEGDQLQHPPVTRSSLNAMNISMLTPPEREQPLLKRRNSAASSGTTPLAVATNRVSTTPKTPKATPKSIEREPKKVPVERERSENVGLEKGLGAMNLKSAASDSSSDSGSRSSGNDASTVTSDGGFTDYLSDESEAELQRQAEVRAALAEQNRAEEQEFRAARRQLATVDLRPPQAWTTGRKAINTGYARGV